MLNGVDMTVTQARAEFADLVNRVAYTGEPVALTRRGKVMAALVSAEDLELLEALRPRRFDFTGAGPRPAPEGRQPPRHDPPRHDPLRIAAEYRPPGPGGPARRPGFGD
jgi:prevent-host-death family protein